MTLKDLAAEAGISVGMASQVERGLANPSLRILEGLRAALRVALTDLLEPGPVHPVPASATFDPKSVLPPQEFVRRAAHRPQLEVGLQGMRKELLSPSGDHAIQFMMIDLPPGATADEVMVGPGEKAGLVMTGRIMLSVGTRLAELGEGDSFQFDSNQTHWVRNPGTDTARILWIMNTQPVAPHF